MGNAKKQLTPDQQFNAIIDRITNDHDDFWLDSIEDQVGDCLTGQSNNEEILKNFELNYSSGSIGIVDFDDLTAEEIRKKIGNDKVLLELLKNSSEILPCDYYIQHNELNSIQIGETEHQIDLCDHEDLQNLLEKFPQLKEKIDGCIIDPFNQMTNDYSTVGGRDDKYLEAVLGDFDRICYRDWETDRKSTRLNSSHSAKSRMPSSA